MPGDGIDRIFGRKGIPRNYLFLEKNPKDLLFDILQ